MAKKENVFQENRKICFTDSYIGNSSCWAVDHQDVLKEVIEKKYNKKALNLTTKQMSSWAQEGLIDDSRENKEEWRKFSICDIATTAILRELRDIGLSLEVLRGLSKELRAPIDGTNVYIPLIATALLSHKTSPKIQEYKDKNIYLEIVKDKPFRLGYEIDLIVLKFSNEPTTASIKVNINKICKEALEDMYEMPVFEANSFELTQNEAIIIDKLRKKEISNLNIQIKDSNFFIEEIENIEEGTYGDHIDNLNVGLEFGEVITKFHHGKIASLQRIRKTKLLNK